MTETIDTDYRTSLHELEKALYFECASTLIYKRLIMKEEYASKVYVKLEKR